MGRLTSKVKSFSGSLVGLAILLIALFFFLNFIASKGWGPFSTLAGAVESHANGSAYNVSAGAPLAGVPSSSSYGPNL